MAVFRVNNRCNGCLACVQTCPAGALKHMDDGEVRRLLHNLSRCARCGNCWRICPQQAIEFEQVLEGSWEEVTHMPLVRCSICGEPLHTADFEEDLNEKLPHGVAPLCALHRKSLTLPLWQRLVPPSSLGPKEHENDCR